MNPANFFISFSVTFLSMFALMPIAKRYGLIDEPGGRKLHARPTPLIGGVGIYLGILVITLFTPDILHHYSSLLAISLPVLLIGVGDDLIELPVSARMGTHALSAVLMCLFAGVQLESLGDIFGTGDVHLGWLAIPFTVFAAVGVINTVNMSDGVDGLSGGMVLIALGFLFAVTVGAAGTDMSSFILILSFALIAFLVFNFQSPWKRAAMVYLGDAGSTFLGFVLAWLLIEATQGTEPVIPAALAPWFLALPLMDTVALLIRRPLKGLSPFHPGRDHLHHYLMDRGLSQSRTVILLLILNTTVGLAGWWLWERGASDAMLFYSFFGLFVIYLMNPLSKPKQ
jgi:UDP-GlcNAc:undecaprenyl-phosphate/decaprenyl-phosphate GlcNAc-1-phosphate transferase